MTASGGTLAALWKSTPQPGASSAAPLATAQHNANVIDLDSSSGSFETKMTSAPGQENQQLTASQSVPAPKRLGTQDIAKLDAALACSSGTLSKQHRDQLAADLSLNVTQVNRWYQRTKKRKATSASVTASAPPQANPAGMPLGSSALATPSVEAAEEAITLSDDEERAGSGSEPAAKRQKGQLEQEADPAAVRVRGDAKQQNQGTPASILNSGSALATPSGCSASSREPSPSPAVLIGRGTAADAPTAAPSGSWQHVNSHRSMSRQATPTASADMVTPAPAAAPATGCAESAESLHTAGACQEAAALFAQSLTPEPQRCANLQQGLQQEMRSAHDQLAAVQPLVPLCTATDVHPFSKAQVAAAVMGSAEPLEVLVQRLTPTLSSGDGAPPVTEGLVKTTILEVAMRKSFSAKDGGAEAADALEDQTAAFLWRWDLREARAVAKKLQPAARDCKKKLQQGHQLLSALSEACKALQDPPTAKAPLKRVAKLLEAAAKHLSAATPASQHTGTAVATPGATPASLTRAAGGKVAISEAAGLSPQPMTFTPADIATQAAVDQSAEKEAKAIMKERERLQKEALKAQKAAEAEQLRVAKAAEADKARAAKAAEAEQVRAAKAAEKASKDAEKQAAKQEKEALKKEKEEKKLQEQKLKSAKKTGMGDIKSVSKAQGLMKMFISKAVPKTPEVAAPVLAAPVAATTDIDAALEAAKQGTTTEEQLRADSDAIVASWKAKRGFHKRIHGMPPTWARKAGLEALMSKTYPDRFRSDYVAPGPTLRSKFIWTSTQTRDGDQPYEKWSQRRRPPFYGPFLRKSSAVRPRAPWGHDSSMDYQAESEDEWEEEPEDAEALSDDDCMSEGGVEPSEAGSDSFFVADGYLSGDEGIAFDDDEDTAMHLGEGPIDLEEEVSDAVLQRRHLAAKIDKAAATNRLLIISALPPPPDCSACEPQADVWHGRAELLEGLRAQVVTPGIFITAPPDEDAEDGAAAAATGTSGKPAPGPGRSSNAARLMERNAALLPQLFQFLLDHPELRSREKVVASFREQHPEAPKNWSSNRVKESAVHSPVGWTIAADVLATHGLADHKPATMPASVPSQPTALPASNAAVRIVLPRATPAVVPDNLTPTAMQPQSPGTLPQPSTAPSPAPQVARSATPASQQLTSFFRPAAESAEPAQPAQRASQRSDMAALGSGPVLGPVVEVSLQSDSDNEAQPMAVDVDARQQKCIPAAQPTAEEGWAAPTDAGAAGSTAAHASSDTAERLLGPTDCTTDELRGPWQVSDDAAYVGAAADSSQPMDCDSPTEGDRMTSPVGATPDATTPTVSAAVAAPPAFAEREAPSHPSAASPPASTAADDLPKFRTGRAPRGPVADVQRDMILSRDSLPATTGDPFWRALEGALSNCAAPPAASNGGRNGAGATTGSSATASGSDRELLRALDRVFTKDAIAVVVPAVPASILAVLLKAVGSPGVVRGVRERACKAITNVAATLAAQPLLPTGSANASKGAERASPPRASVAALLGEPLLLPAVCACLLAAEASDPHQNLGLVPRAALRLLATVLAIGIPDAALSTRRAASPVVSVADPGEAAAGAAAAFRLRAAEGAEGADLVVELAALARRHGTDNAAAAQAARALAALFAEPAACRVAAAPGVAHADRLSQALLGAAVCEDQPTARYATAAVFHVMGDPETVAMLVPSRGSATDRQRNVRLRALGRLLALLLAQEGEGPNTLPAILAVTTWLEVDSESARMLLRRQGNACVEDNLKVLAARGGTVELRQAASAALAALTAPLLS